MLLSCGKSEFGIKIKPRLLEVWNCDVIATTGMGRMPNSDNMYSIAITRGARDGVRGNGILSIFTCTESFNVRLAIGGRSIKVSRGLEYPSDSGRLITSPSVCYQCCMVALSPSPFHNNVGWSNGYHLPDSTRSVVSRCWSNLLLR